MTTTPAMHGTDVRSRNHAGYWAFLAHRVSGIVLVLFLPVHFFVLSRALRSPGALDRFFEWTSQPAVKFAETLLVLALAVHLAGGVRLLFAEFVRWRAEGQKTAIAIVAAVAVACALLFALNA